VSPRTLPIGASWRPPHSPACPRWALVLRAPLQGPRPTTYPIPGPLFFFYPLQSSRVASTAIIGVISVIGVVDVGRRHGPLAPAPPPPATAVGCPRCRPSWRLWPPSSLLLSLMLRLRDPAALPSRRYARQKWCRQQRAAAAAAAPAAAATTTAAAAAAAPQTTVQQRHRPALPSERYARKRWRRQQRAAAAATAAAEYVLRRRNA
jgi:pyruvate/2-oxoglutarate dehydrogenase complex dihydrolipoamide acyltransferase (E2) component